jgi:hypothetical protein
MRPSPPDPKTRRPEARRPHILVAGSRSILDKDLVWSKLDFYLSKVRDPVIVHGGAEGADDLARRWAEWNWYLHKCFRPDYDRYHPKVAPKMRNQEMVDYLGGFRNAAVIAFHDGKSRGTVDLIERAEKAGFKPKIVRF